jgi:hypothetical protein
MRRRLDLAMGLVGSARILGAGIDASDGSTWRRWPTPTTWRFQRSGR